MMTVNDWKDVIYKVFYFQSESPLHMQAWLGKMYIDEGLNLISASGDYYIFKPIENVITSTLEQRPLEDALLARAMKAEAEANRYEQALTEIADQAGTIHNADWARRRAIEALKGGEK